MTDFVSAFGRKLSVAGPQKGRSKASLLIYVVENTADRRTYRAKTIKETGRIRSPLGWYPPPGTSPNRCLLKRRASRIGGRAGCVIADHTRLVREKCALAGLSNGNR